MAVADLPNISDTTESNAYIADRKSVLETVLFTALHGDELIAVAGQFPKDANFLIGDKTAFDKANANRSPIHLESFASSLLPFTALTI